MTFRVYDVNGRAVMDLPARTLPAGTWIQTIDRELPRAGGTLPAGMYWISMSVDGHDAGQQKVVILD